MASAIDRLQLGRRRDEILAGEPAAVARALEDLRREYVAGSGVALLLAMTLAAAVGAAPPAWACSAWVDAIAAWSAFRVRNLDAALELPAPRRLRLRSWRMLSLHGDALVRRIVALRANGLRGPRVFEVAAVECGISARAARRLYYRARRLNASAHVSPALWTSFPRKVVSPDARATEQTSA